MTKSLEWMTVCLLPVGQAYGQFVYYGAQQENLREMVTEAADTDVVQAEEKSVMLQKYANLHEENKALAGWLYVRKQADFDDGTNFIIYGHNMKDGVMFGDLDLYLKERTDWLSGCKKEQRGSEESLGQECRFGCFV